MDISEFVKQLAEDLVLIRVLNTHDTLREAIAAALGSDDVNITAFYHQLRQEEPQLKDEVHFFEKGRFYKLTSTPVNTQTQELTLEGTCIDRQISWKVKVVVLSDTMSKPSVRVVGFLCQVPQGMCHEVKADKPPYTKQLAEFVRGFREAINV